MFNKNFNHEYIELMRKSDDEYRSKGRYLVLGRGNVIFE